MINGVVKGKHTPSVLLMSYLPLSGAGLRVLTWCLSMTQRLKNWQNKKLAKQDFVIC